MSNVHILPDENLGGVLREFREVERKAKVGDKKLLPDGTILTAVEPYDRGKGKTPGMWFQDTCGNMYPYYNDDNNRLIEPTDIVHIDGARYRLVDRKAKVGEKVMYYKDGKSDGVVTTCIGYNERFNDRIDVEPYLAKGDDEVTCGFVHGYYRVLEPVEPAETDDDVLTVDETEVSKSVLDLLANLARRVTELERQQKENREYIIKAFESISGKDDEYTVEERVARLERTFTEYMRRVNTIETDIEELNTDLATIEENVEMALDDIVTLDERTQPLVALVKAVKGDE